MTTVFGCTTADDPSGRTLRSGNAVPRERMTIVRFVVYHGETGMPRGRHGKHGRCCRAWRGAKPRPGTGEPSSNAQRSLFALFSSRCPVSGAIMDERGAFAESRVRVLFASYHSLFVHLRKSRATPCPPYSMRMMPLPNSLRANGHSNDGQST